MSFVKVIWDLHFLLVHHRVFKQAMAFLAEHELDDVKSMKQETFVLLRSNLEYVPSGRKSLITTSLDDGDSILEDETD